LVKFGVLTLLIGGGDELVALILEPFSQTQLILGGAQETRLVASVLVTLSRADQSMLMLQRGLLRVLTS
jgi:hypothetical protein